MIGQLQNEGDLKRWLDRYLGESIGLIKGPQIKGAIVPEAFIEPPALSNSWANFGGVYAPISYMKDRMGFVHLRGVVENGTVGTTIFTLPADYRPEFDEPFPFLSGFNGVVLSTGEVRPNTAAGNTFVSIGGLTFKADS